MTGKTQFVCGSDVSPRPLFSNKFDECSHVGTWPSNSLPFVPIWPPFTFISLSYCGTLKSWTFLVHMVHSVMVLFFKNNVSSSSPADFLPSRKLNSSRNLSSSEKLSSSRRLSSSNRLSSSPRLSPSAKLSSSRMLSSSEIGSSLKISRLLIRAFASRWTFSSAWALFSDGDS